MSSPIYKSNEMNDPPPSPFSILKRNASKETVFICNHHDYYSGSFA